MLKERIVYIADFSLPNKSAYTLHVLKICDAFSEYTGKKTELIIPHLEKKYSYKKIKKDYKLKYGLNIKSFFKKKIKFNFLRKIFFSIDIIDYLKKNKTNSIIISRSIVPSIILGFFNIKNTLEIHTEMTGLTKIFFNFTKISKIMKNLNFIFINSNLRKKLKIHKNKSIILSDAVDHRDFKRGEKKILRDTCFYSGSFAKGKGLELILKISRKLPNINFHLFGNEETIFDESILKKIPKNVHFKGYLTYSALTQKIEQYKVLLMPYQQKVSVLIKNVNVATYFSPLKMFDYLAAGKIIIASNLPVYRHILKNKNNSILLENKTNHWCKNINLALKTNKFDHLKKIAKEDSKKYSWINRVKKIINFIKKNV